jgi:Fur family ferric uptake transcriptional regulator
MNEIEKKLFEHYIKPTPKRIAIATELAGAKQPLTAQELLETLQTKLDVNKVTLYRTLELFEEHGFLIKHQAADRSFRYCYHNLADEFHCHFLCVKCGSMQCLPPEKVGIDPQKVRSNIPQLTNAEIRLDGICDSCRD